MPPAPPPRPCATSFRPTPLQRNAFLSERFGAEIWLKREDLSPVRSYKIRGAFNAMRKRLSAEPGKRASSVPARATMRRAWPLPVPISGCRARSSCRSRRRRRRSTRPRLRRRQCRDPAGGRFLRRNARRGQAFAPRPGAFPVALRRCPRDRGAGLGRGRDAAATGRTAGHLVLPVGGGGLSAGMIRYLRARHRRSDVVTLVEPAGGPSLTAALKRARRWRCRSRTPSWTARPWRGSAI
jgi:threonine dehydratase